MIKLHVTPGNLVTPDHIKDEEGQLLASVYETALTPLFTNAPEMLELLQRAANIMASLERLLDTSLMGTEAVEKTAWENDLVTLLNKIEGGGE